MTKERWSYRDGGHDMASALLDNDVLVAIIYNPWGGPLAKRIAELLNKDEDD